MTHPTDQRKAALMAFKRLVHYLPQNLPPEAEAAIKAEIKDVETALTAPVQPRTVIRKGDTLIMTDMEGKTTEYTLDKNLWALPAAPVPVEGEVLSVLKDLRELYINEKGCYPPPYGQGKHAYEVLQRVDVMLTKEGADGR